VRAQQTEAEAEAARASEPRLVALTLRILTHFSTLAMGSGDGGGGGGGGGTQAGAYTRSHFRST